MSKLFPTFVYKYNYIVMTNANNKSSKELKNMTTKRLLSYYKAERKRMIRFKNSHTCECCGQTDWELTCLDKNWKDTVNKDYVRMLSKQYYEKLSYLDAIKTILDTREHVKYK